MEYDYFGMFDHYLSPNYTKYSTERKPIMDKLNDRFQQFLNDGARDNILSEEFKRDVTAVLGEVEDEEMPYAPDSNNSVIPSMGPYYPDHDLGSTTDHEYQSPPGSICDPLDDETSSIIGELEKIATSPKISQWDGSSRIIWASPGIYKTHQEFRQTRNLLKTVLASINRDTGLNYSLNIGSPDTLFITRQDSLTVSRPVKSQKPKALFSDDEKWDSIKFHFASGIKLKDIDEPGKYLFVSFATPGFSEADVKLSYLDGNITVKKILENIWRSMGRWTYISSSYKVDDIII